MASLNRSWPLPPRTMRASARNVSETERWISAVAGAALAAWALERRSRDAWLLGVLGATLLYRASTGRCPMYAAAGISTAGQDASTRRALSGRGGVIVDCEVAVDRPVGELYSFWRKLENLPRVMQHLQSVTVYGESRSHWVATAPLGSTVEWDAEIINEVPDKLIGWRSLEGSTVATAGSVTFDPLPAGGTNVRVRLQYDPPGGKLGSWVAWVFGEEPSVQIAHDLQRFKQLAEAGELY